MNRMAVTLAGSGCAVAVGLILMAIGTQAVLEDVIQGSGTVGAGEYLEVEVAMDPDAEATGVFAVQVLETVEGSEITARVLDPLGSVVAFEDVKEDSIEGRFDVTDEGAHRLIVENEGEGKPLAFGAIGPLPDASARALAFIPFYILLAGVMGMAGLAIYWAASIRRKTS